MLKEFRDFITRGNLVELAVAFILGLAFAAVVTAFTNIILSLIAAIFGGATQFRRLTATLNGTPIPIGMFVTALIDFIIIAFVLFLIVKAYNRMKRKQESNTRPCPFCKTDIPKDATRCSACTSEVAATPAA
jgi:large conductance mechanosensitive channel